MCRRALGWLGRAMLAWLTYLPERAGGISKEIAMAKAKKRVTTRKKSARRGKASTKSARKKAAKHTITKKAKSKVRRAGRGALESTARKKQPLKTAARKAPRNAASVVEDAIIDVIDEPMPAVFRVTEYETVQTTSPDDPEKNGN